MCGIAAFIGSPPPPTTEVLARLAHRGPDAAGEWRSPTAWLGHRRLAINDLSPAGHQPLANEDGSLQLVGNGEIYNAPTLRQRLEQQGHRFRSHSDNEVILHLYEEVGDAAPEYLIGMFAFALWDEKRQRLLAARDRVGIKPLAYAPLAHGLALASEVTALLPMLPQQPEPNPLALAYAMTLGYVPAPHAIWQGVRKLPPGHTLTWEREHGLRTRRYWEPPRELGTGGGDWETLFESVVSEHLLSDVPVGLFLSGGLDSGAVGLALHRLGRSAQAMTIAFPGADPRENEATAAAWTAARLHLPHRAIPLAIPELGALVGQAAASLDEPQGYSSILPMLLLSQEAAKSHKVILAGDGGDEALGGYAWYRDLDTPGSFHPRAARLGRRLLRPLLQGRAPPAMRQQAATLFSRASLLHRHAWRVFPRFLPEEVAFLLAPMGLRFDDETMLAPLAEHYLPTLPTRRALQRVDLMTFCSGHVLAKVDRASMAHALEVRVPFLDHRILEWSLSRPVEPRESQAAKVVIRDYLERHGLGEILARPKQGFSLRGLDEATVDGLFLERIAASAWVQQGWWHKEWRRLLEPGVPYRQARVWVMGMMSMMPMGND